jgi:hypothetical protein
MSVPMMGVGAVRMGVDAGLVPVRVGVGLSRRGVVVMVMVPVVVSMGVIVGQLVVGVGMQMPLGQV